MHTLDFSSSEQVGEGLKWVKQVMQGKSQTIRGLNFGSRDDLIAGFQRFSDPHFDTLRDLLRDYPQLTSLDLSNHKMTAAQFQTLVSQISNDSQLTTLCLAHNQIDQTQLQTFLATPQGKHLVWLDLSHNGLHVDQSLCDLFMNHDSLKVLLLDGTLILITGDGPIANLLNNSQLEMLSFSLNGTGGTFLELEKVNKTHVKKMKVNLKTMSTDYVGAYATTFAAMHRNNKNLHIDLNLQFVAIRYSGYRCSMENMERLKFTVIQS